MSRFKAIAIIFAAGYVISRTTSAPSNSPTAQPIATAMTSQQREAENKRSAVAACRGFIRRRLKDPDSVDFLQLMDDVSAVRTGAGEYSAVLGVRAKNSYGARMVSNFSCKVRCDDQNCRLIDLTETNL